MSRVANTYWVDERIRSQRALPRTGASLPSMRQISLDIVGTPADVRRRGGLIPSWVVFGMVLLASLAVCVTVNMRTRAKVQLASEQFTSIRSDVDTLRALNQTLRSEVEELRTNPRAIESAARNRLNMVRSNEIVVPVDE